MGHPPVVHEAEDGTAERKERIEIRQFSPYDQRDGRRPPIALLQARLGQQRSGKTMGQIIGHTSLSISSSSRSAMTCGAGMRLSSKRPYRAIQTNGHGHHAPTPGGVPQDMRASP